MEVGTKLNHYEILEPLGAGGMGEVYRARDTNLKRDVAIKVLPKELAADEERLARLEREAQLLASLNHPNIAAIYNLEEAAGTRWLVLELVEGETLEEKLVAGPIPVRDSLRIGSQVAAALEAAHERGIVHRDLKPANVMVDTKGNVKVLDLGIAKVIFVGGRRDDNATEYSAAGSADPSSVTRVATRMAAQLTATGVLIGTAPYMSPEQIRGLALDKRSDVWSFGCLMFELLSGRRAFDRETMADTLSAILEHEPNENLLPPETPESIEKLIRRCLQKDVDARLHDIADARIEIDGALREIDTHDGKRDSGSAGKRPPRLSVRLAVAALVVVISAIAYVTMQNDEGGVAAPTMLRIATADSTTGYYFATGMGIAEIVERELLNVNVQVISTDGSFENAALLDRGAVELALVQNDIVFNSVKTRVVLGQRSNNITGLAVLYEDPLHIVVRQDAGIATVDDLRARKVDIGLPGSGNRFTSEILLSHFGIEVDDLTRSFLPAGDANISLLSGGVQASMMWVAAPYPPLQQIFRSGDVQLVSIDPKMAEGLNANHPFLIPATIAATTYANQRDAANTVALKTLLVGAASLDADLVYRLLEAIFANISDLIAHHPRAADISPATAFGLDNGMPIDLHPGAERYWREQASR